jgi:hypothetical protein
MKTLVLVLVLMFAGCYLDSKWEDVPGAKVTAVADRPEDQAVWDATVQSAVDAWAEGLRAYGCAPPFTTGANGHPIRFIYDESMNKGEQWGDGIGEPYPGIEIRSRFPEKITLVLHEMGHAIGLEHSTYAEGTSVMLPEVVWGTPLQTRDLAAAACELGCGPCDGLDDY